METRYFFTFDGTLVVSHLEASQAEWSDEPQAGLVRVDSETFDAVANGSTLNPDGTYTPPPPPVTVLRIKKTAFIEILTPTEYVAMLGPQTDPQLAWGVGLYDAASDPFLTEDPQVETMLNYCASTGVLTQARANQIYAEMIAASKPFPE